MTNQTLLLIYLQTRKHSLKIIYILLFLFAFIIRFPSFNYLSLDDDEGIYMLMGKFITEGHLPYVHYWDHQPPVIYLLCAILQLLNIKSIYGVRILATLFVSSGSFMLYNINKYLFKNTLIAILIALFYIVNTSARLLDGLAFNNELIFNFFNLSAFFILLKSFKEKNNSLRNIIFSGLILGFAFLTKQQVIYDFLSFCIYIILFNEQRNYKSHPLIIFVFATLIPFLIISIIFLFSGHITEYINAIWTSNIKYIKFETITKESIRYALIHLKPLAFFFPFIFLPFAMDFSLISKKNIHILNSKFKIFIFLWFLLVLYGTTISKTFYPHYFLQLLPPVSILLGLFLAKIFSFSKAPKFILFIIFISCSFLSLKNNNFILKIKAIDDDPIYAASQFLKENKKQNDSLFIVDGDVIIYYLAGFDILTKYAFPVHLSNEKYSYAFNFNQIDELENVLNKNPNWIIFEKAMRFDFRNITQFKQNQLIHKKLNNYKKVETFSSLNQDNIIEIFHKEY